MPRKIALVTGGSRGLGRDMALSLARRGIGVVLTYNSNRDAAMEVRSEVVRLGAQGAVIQLDVGDLGSFDAFYEEIVNELQATFETDKFDFLINNAGVGATLPIPEVTEDAFDDLMNIHVKGAFFLTQKALPHLNDWGGIVFVSTGSTRFCVPGYAVYASMKGSLEVLTKYVAKELGERKIRANIVAPGAIETDFNNAAIRSNPKMKAFIESQTALGRVGKAHDIGSVVAFLCTDEAKWINAQRIEASGGMFL